MTQDLTDGVFMPETRAEHQIGMCFPLYTRVGVEEFEEAYARPITRSVGEEDFLTYSETLMEHPDRIVLPIVMSHLVASHIDRRNSNPNSFDDEHDISERDLDFAEKFDTFEHGFADPDFAWHFSAGIASSVVDQMIFEGKMTHELRAQMTLTDWADIISSGWFSDLIHSLAFTSNGMYGRFGNSNDEYNPDALKSQIGWLQKNGLVVEKAPLFEIAVEPVNSFEATYPEGAFVYTAKATRDLKAFLRAKITDKTKSVGCPVARHRAPMPEEQLEHDPHTIRLIELGRLIVEEDRTPDDGEVPVSIDHTAIDDALLVFGDKLREYDNLFGTPVIGDVPNMNPRRDRHWFKVAGHEKRAPVLGGFVAPSEPTPVSV